MLVDMSFINLLHMLVDMSFITFCLKKNKQTRNFYLSFPVRFNRRKHKGGGGVK